MAFEPDNQSVDSLYNKMNTDAESSGYHLNPDVEFTKDLVKSLLINEQRFGYQACPCRRASGIKAEDLDIICPCDYRDADVTEYDACYCGLYVSQKVKNGEKQAMTIPERRPIKAEREKIKMKEEMGKRDKEGVGGNLKLSLPVWRCKVCGYLCAREDAPEVCPICKVKKDRFERFI